MLQTDGRQTDGRHMAKNQLSTTFCTLCQNDVFKKLISYRVSVADTPISQLSRVVLS